jgi:Holliday junction resolvase RusA-like endonuclease
MTSKTTTTSEFFLEVEPVPASRPRVSKWGVFYGKRYERFRREMREVLSPFPVAPLAGPIEVSLEFVVPPPKTVKREIPRGDIDNYVKGPLDSMTSHGGFWTDDEQVVLVHASKRYATEGEPNGIRIRIRNCKADASAM